MYGTVARAAARFKNARRVMFNFVFNIAVSYILASCLYLELPIMPAQLSRNIGTEPDFQMNTKCVFDLEIKTLPETF